MGLAEEPDSSSESRSKSVLIIVRSCSSCSCDALSVDSGCSDTTCSFSARLCPLPSAIRFFFGSGRKRGKIISVAGKKKETKKMEHSLSGEKVDHKIFLPNTLLTHTYKKKHSKKIVDTRQCTNQVRAESGWDGAHSITQQSYTLPVLGTDKKGVRYPPWH